MRITLAIAIIAAAMSGFALAKLPPLTPEQQQAAEAKKEAEKTQLEKEKVALGRAQDRVAEHYKRTKDNVVRASAAGKMEDTNMPKATRELPRDAAPQGGTRQSAEAHSAPAR
jgi:hypothetical protein